MVGRNYAGEINVNSCINNAAIVAGEKAGGIVGHISSGAYDATVEHCTNNGAVTVHAQALANKVGYVAGIVGSHMSDVKLTVSGCTSNGDITLTVADNATIKAEKLMADRDVTTEKPSKLTLTPSVGDAQVTAPSAE